MFAIYHCFLIYYESLPGGVGTGFTVEVANGTESQIFAKIRFDSFEILSLRNKKKKNIIIYNYNL